MSRLVSISVRRIYSSSGETLGRLLYLFLVSIGWHTRVESKHLRDVHEVNFENLKKISKLSNLCNRILKNILTESNIF